MRHTLAAAVIAGFSCIASADAPDVASGRVAEQDQRLRYISGTFDDAMRASSVVIADGHATAYLQQVLERLFPEHASEMRVAIIRSPEPNAFVAANGSIYVQNAMLARIDTEAQLAYVLAHEGAHYIRRHMAYATLAAKTAGVTGLLASAITGVPLFGALYASTSYEGFAISVERDADMVALERVSAAGYALDNLLAPLWRVAREREYIRGYGRISATDRHLLERLDLAQGLVRGHPAAHRAGETGGERYRSATEAVRMGALEEMLAHREFDPLIVLLGNDAVVESLPPEARYFRGEAYRLRNARGDDDRAYAEYTAVIDRLPTYAPVWRGLGELHMRHRRNDVALAAFETYLDLDPASPDAGFVRYYAARLQAHP